ncbi:hypothetical protein CWI39_2075p0020 [Hamiltosporidium magnivora]|uniref:Leucine-rich repeat-containing protein n=1 Tax=Hamiltosporidium magnivora TaxID=148818 RepID=A0A4Q9KYI7_9MICR|nr:hypothetical protein CWI39_2075p0020 [Hamiltosporidium magnivora]
MMIGLQEIYFDTTNTIKLNPNNEKFDFRATNKDISDSEYPIDSLKFLFQNYEMSSIKQLLLIRDFSIDNLNVKAFNNLLNLKKLNICRINFQNISFSELFCALQEYKIKRMKLEEINISEKDIIFIATLRKLEYIIFDRCVIQKETKNWLKFLFFNEFYIIVQYYMGDYYLSEDPIKFISEKFKTKYIVIEKI